MTRGDGRLDDPEWLEEQYWREGRSLRDIADEVGTSDSVVRRRLLEHGLGTRGQGRRAGSSHERLGDEDWLREQYVERGRSTSDLADAVGCTPPTVAYWLRKHGIEVRPPGRPAEPG